MVANRVRRLWMITSRKSRTRFKASQGQPEQVSDTYSVTEPMLEFEVTDIISDEKEISTYFAKSIRKSLIEGMIRKG